MTTINTYRVRYAFHLDGTRKEMTATREGISPLHVAGIDSADMDDLFDLPRTDLFAWNGKAFAQVGHEADGMYLVMMVEKEKPNAV